MNTNIDEKINLIKKANTDDTRFIINVYESYLKYKNKLNNQRKKSSIILKKIHFFKNFKAYVIVNAFLAVINFIFTPM